jgi:hypothetical protein
MSAAEDVLTQADAALGRAHALCAELNCNVGLAQAICRRAHWHATFQAELPPPVAIALLVREQTQDVNS